MLSMSKNLQSSTLQISCMDDLLDEVDDEEFEDDQGSLEGCVLQKTLISEPMTMGCSEALQNIVDQFQLEEFSGLEFSVTIADPNLPDCPLVACSIGFTKLTGYHIQEIVGRNCRFLLNGVPPNLIEKETRMRCRSFCVSISEGSEYDCRKDELPTGNNFPLIVPKGAIMTIQTNAKKTRELFRNMFYMRQVELDDDTYILGLQAGLPEDFDTGDAGTEKFKKTCQAAWDHLHGHMRDLEQVLAKNFWFEAPMGRQD